MSQQKPIISTSFSYETLEEKLDIKPKGAQVTYWYSQGERLSRKTGLRSRQKRWVC